MAARRVLVLFRDPLLRDLVTHLLGEAPEVEIVGVFALDEVNAAAVAALQPDVVVVDTRDMPQSSNVSEWLAHLPIPATTRRVIALSLSDTGMTVITEARLERVTPEALIAAVTTPSPGTASGDSPGGSPESTAR